MMTETGKYVCDREIGSIAKGWHQCGARARYGVSRSSAQGFVHELHFCAAHHNAATRDLLRVRSMHTTAERVL